MRMVILPSCMWGAIWQQKKFHASKGSAVRRDKLAKGRMAPASSDPYGILENVVATLEESGRDAPPGRLQAAALAVVATLEESGRDAPPGRLQAAALAVVATLGESGRDAPPGRPSGGPRCRSHAGRVR